MIEKKLQYDYFISIVYNHSDIKFHWDTLACDDIWNSCKLKILTGWKGLQFILITLYLNSMFDWISSFFLVKVLKLY